MLAAAKAAGKLLMVAHVLPFFPEFKYAAQVIRDGRFGKLLAGSFKRVISRPDWSADIGDAAKTGGPAIDLHVHDTHFIGLVCGVPKSVFSTGVVENNVVQHLTTAYDYGPGGLSITCTSGALSMSGRPFVHGYELYFEKATLVYMAGTCPLTLITAGKSEPVSLPGSGDPVSAFTEEIQAAVDGAATGKMPELLSGQLARDALVMCYRECESVVERKAVAIDIGSSPSVVLERGFRLQAITKRLLKLSPHSTPSGTPNIILTCRKPRHIKSAKPRPAATHRKRSQYRGRS